MMHIRPAMPVSMLDLAALAMRNASDRECVRSYEFAHTQAALALASRDGEAALLALDRLCQCLNHGRSV